MLYYFPDESIEDLSRKESESLQKEIQNAKRVETRGYRQKECSLPSLYVEWKCLHEYLQCPLDKWTLPVGSKDKVELEELETEFLPPLKPYKPLIYYDPKLKENVQRIVGYREILKKRECIKYLEEIESLCVENDDDGGISEGPLDGVSSIDSDSDSTSSNETEEGEEEFVGESEHQKKVDNDENGWNVQENATTSKLQHQYLRIARGGGGDKEKKKEDKNKKSKKDDKKKKEAGKDKSKKKEKEGPGIIERMVNYVKKKVGLGPKNDKEKNKDGKDKKKGEKDKKKDKKDKKDMKGKPEKEKDEKAAEPKEPKVKSSRWIFSATHEDLLKQKHEEKEHQENLEAIFKYHTLFRVPAMKERDSEWLELSDTDPEEQRHEIGHAGKTPAPWMVPGISFESQYLVSAMNPFLWSLRLTGRLFMGVKPDMVKKHMDFSHKKKNILLFFVTSIFFWVALCLMASSFMDIQWENQKRETTVLPGSNRTADNLTDTSTDQQDVINKVGDAYHHIEELELHKYQIPLCVIIINLILVAVWSMLVILGDGILIAHYFNCWCAALAEMETSGSLKIRLRIIAYHIFYFSYVGILSVLFYIDYPSHIRYSCSMIASLIVRPIYPNLRVKPDDELLPFQLAGLAFQCYVVYCSMMIKLLIQIVALVLKNSSEMWNFKFALTYQQLAVKNRGQLYRMGLNHSLLKLFTHHRLLTVLLRNFGEVFAVPIIIYMVCEMAVMTLTMVRMFFYKPGAPDQFGGHETVVINSINSTGSLTETIEIRYYHTAAEENIIFAVTLLQMTVQFLSTTETLAAAGNSFFAGYEFVRRSGTMLCRNSHQRRLIQSLEWSFSSTNPSVMSANSFFTINRQTILGAFTAVAGFFSLIIQLQVDSEEIRIEFVNITDCKKIGESFELVRGECLGRAELDLGLIYVNSTF